MTTSPSHRLARRPRITHSLVSARHLHDRVHQADTARPGDRVTHRAQRVEHDWIAFASPCTSPNMFGLPGCAAKSSISSLRKNPAALTYTPEPKSALSVVVVATALPAASTTE